MTINKIQDEIIEEFEEFEEWMDKYEYLIDLGKNLQKIDEKFKTKENLIEGCQSRVWLHADLQDETIRFSADSDAIITKGLVALLVRVLDNQSPADVMNADLYFIDKIGLSQNLSPTRSNGLLSMMKQIKMYGIAFNHKLNQN